eukprot:9187130-Lingulodinium_polyedra.AAC.1
MDWLDANVNHGQTRSGSRCPTDCRFTNTLPARTLQHGRNLIYHALVAQTRTKFPSQTLLPLRLRRRIF